MKLLLHMVFSFFLGFTMLMFPFSVFAVTLGSSPAVVEFGKVLEKVPKKQMILLERSGDLRDDLTVLVEFQQGAESLFQGEEKIYFPEGVRTVSYPMVFRGSSLPYGSYEAIVHFTPFLNEDELSQNGLAIRLHYEMSDEMINDFRFHSITPQVTEEGEAISLQVQFENTGNTFWKPDTLGFDVKDDRGLILTKSENISSELASIQPGTKGIYLLQANDVLPKGEYHVDVYGFIRDEHILARQLLISVVPQGSHEYKGRLLTLNTTTQFRETDSSVLVAGAFLNESDIPTEAHLVLELSKDNRILAVERTRAVTVGVQDTHLFYHTLTLAEPGDYRLVGYVVYNERTTGTVMHDFRVQPPVFHRVIRWALLPLGLALLFFGGLLIYVHRFANHRYSYRVILRPVYANGGDIHGYADAPTGSIVEVIKNHKHFGTTKVKKGKWRLRNNESLIHGDMLRAKIVHGIHQEKESFSEEVIVV